MLRHLFLSSQRHLYGFFILNSSVLHLAQSRSAISILLCISPAKASCPQGFLKTPESLPLTPVPYPLPCMQSTPLPLWKVGAKCYHQCKWVENARLRDARGDRRCWPGEKRRKQTREKPVIHGPLPLHSGACLAVLLVAMATCSEALLGQ